jgi:uncharacterized protein YukE
MDGFTFNHGNYADAASTIGAHLGRVSQILDDLNGVVAPLPDAAPGGAIAPWKERQMRWTATYQDAVDQLNQRHSSINEIGDIFHGGDQQTTNIMMG